MRDVSPGGPHFTSFRHHDAQNKDTFSFSFSSKGKGQGNEEATDGLAHTMGSPWPASESWRATAGQMWVLGLGISLHRLMAPPASHGCRRRRENHSRRTRPAVLIQTMLTKPLLCAGHRGNWDEHHRPGLCPCRASWGAGV